MPLANGWQLFAHPLLLAQLEKLAADVERLRAKDPGSFHGSPKAKVLAAVRRLMFDIIPSNPARSEYRQGGTLGAGRKHWFRAKFGGQRFRLFFRYSAAAKIIIFAWVNDEDTLRAYGARIDAYAIFRAMLESGNPPDSWSDLAAAATATSAIERFAKLGTET